MTTVSKKQLFSLLGAAFVLLAIPATVYLSGQKQFFGQKAQTVNKLICDAGSDPYDSTTITVTNNTDKKIERLISNIFRCTYSPNKIKKGYFFCDSLVGRWDQQASKIVSLEPGKSVTFNMTINPCEIAQVDAYNEEVHTGESIYECWNTRSQYTNPAPPNWWPGGIAFGIAENSTGYNAATGTCPQPTATPAPTNQPQPTNPPPTNPPPTLTPTRQPTAPPGQPTYTPYPTATPYPTQPPILYTPIPTRPVAGNATVTIIGVLGGLGLLLLAVL